MFCSYPVLTQDALYPQTPAIPSFESSDTKFSQSDADIPARLVMQLICRYVQREWEYRLRLLAISKDANNQLEGSRVLGDFTEEATKHETDPKCC